MPSPKPFVKSHPRRCRIAGITLQKVPSVKQQIALVDRQAVANGSHGWQSQCLTSRRLSQTSPNTTKPNQTAGIKTPGNDGIGWISRAGLHPFASGIANQKQTGCTQLAPHRAIISKRIACCSVAGTSRSLRCSTTDQLQSRCEAMPWVLRACVCLPHVSLWEDSSS